MNNIMVDLETLGTVPGCVVLSIGAVAFDASGTYAEFYQQIYTPSCTERFLTVNKATMKWWEAQTPEARRILHDCNDPLSSVDLPTALNQFTSFVEVHGDDVRVWGNGADFDNALLTVAYDVCGRKIPWKFYNSRCYRTLKEQFPDIKLERTGTYHNALDDARCQAVHAARLLRRLQSLEMLLARVEDGSAGEGSGAELQSEGAAISASPEHKAESTGDRIPRQNVPTGL